MQQNKPNKLGLYNLIAVILGILVGIACHKVDYTIFCIGELAPIGKICVDLFSWFAIPLVFFSVVDKVASLKGVKQHKTIIIKSLACFVVTTIIACVIGIVVALVFTHCGFFRSIGVDGKSLVGNAQEYRLLQAVLSVLPDHLIDAILKENIVTVLLFSLLTGYSILVADSGVDVFKQIIVSVSFVVRQMVAILVRLSPFCVFLLTVLFVLQFDYASLGGLMWLSLALAIGYILHFLITYVLLLKFVARFSILKFIKKIFPAMVFAMASTSSIASIPVTEEVSESIGVRDTVTRLVIPVASVMNMDGTAVYLAIVGVFFATGSAVSLSLWQMVLMMGTILLSVFGTAGVPGAGFIMLALVLGVLDLDVNLIMFVYAADKLFDIGRTCLNVTGDLVSAACIEHWCKQEEEKTHYKQI